MYTYLSYYPYVCVCIYYLYRVSRDPDAVSKRSVMIRNSNVAVHAVAPPAAAPPAAAAPAGGCCCWPLCGSRTDVPRMQCRLFLLSCDMCQPGTAWVRAGRPEPRATPVPGITRQAEACTRSTYAHSADNFVTFIAVVYVPFRSSSLVVQVPRGRRTHPAANFPQFPTPLGIHVITTDAEWWGATI